MLTANDVEHNGSPTFTDAMGIPPLLETDAKSTLPPCRSQHIPRSNKSHARTDLHLAADHSDLGLRSEPTPFRICRHPFLRKRNLSWSDLANVFPHRVSAKRTLTPLVSEWNCHQSARSRS